MVPEAVTLQPNEVLGRNSGSNGEKRRKTAVQEAAKDQRERAL